MRKIVFFIVAYLFNMQLSLAATFSVHQEILLPNWDDFGNQNWVFFIFEEENPGVISDSYSSNGCELIIYSTQKSLPKGDYKVLTDETLSPEIGDKRWYRNFKLEWSDGTVTLSCKTDGGYFFINPIDMDYINEVAINYLTIKR